MLRIFEFLKKDNFVEKNKKTIIISNKEKK